MSEYVCQSFFGSVQESEEARDFSGFIFIAERDPAAVVAVENVGTRVVCGFPSAGDKGRKLPFGVARDPPARHFHSESRGFRPFSAKTTVDHRPGVKTSLFTKPRRSGTFTDSCSEPKSN